MGKRIYEYDLTRIVLMLTLPLIHVVQYWGYICGGADLIVRSDADVVGYLAQLSEYFCAPCFMVMMGINMMLTSHNAPKEFLRRGILLLCIELVFNLVRYLLPACIGFVIGEYKPDVMAYAIFGVLNSDILAFAGLAFIVMAGLRKLNASSGAVMAVALAMWAAGLLTTRLAAPWLCGHCSGQFLNLLGSFVWVNGDSTFPLLYWMIFPAAGYMFADRLRKAGSGAAKETVWRVCGIAGLAVMALEIVLALCTGRPIYQTLCLNGADHYVSPWVAFFGISTSFLLMWLCHLLAPMFERSTNAIRVVTALGSRLTTYYILQWTIVGWGLFITGGMGLWGCQKLTLWPTVLAIVAIAALSCIPAAVSQLITKPVSTTSRVTRVKAKL